MQYQHGGDIYSYAEQFGGRIPLDFSANINPRGMPIAVRQAIQDAALQCDRYPDPQCRALRAALGRRWELDPQKIFCGNGAAEIFYRLIHCLRPKRALLTAPTFGEYEAALMSIECKPILHFLSAQNQFCLTDNILDAITDDLDLLILCNPNNPTGCTIHPALLVKIIKRCIQTKTWLILDECFCDFVEDHARYEMRAWIDQMERLVIVRAFTKMYAIPGVRLGWCMTANLSLITALEQVGQPWNVSVIAQQCGLAALTCENWETESAKEIARNRTQFAQALTACGFQVFPSQANYLLFYTIHTDLDQSLASRGILIRSCANYHGLGAGYFRVAVRTPQEHQVFIQAIQEVLWQKQL